MAATLCTVPFFPLVETRETAVCPECFEEVTDPARHWNASHGGLTTASCHTMAMEIARQIAADDDNERKA